MPSTPVPSGHTPHMSSGPMSQDAFTPGGMTTGSARNYGEQPRIYVPGGPLKQCRSCLSCRILLTLKQFCQGGCPNCPELNMHDEDERTVIELTTGRYQGAVSIMKHGGWVSRYCKLGDDMALGIYAVTIEKEEGM